MRSPEPFLARVSDTTLARSCCFAFFLPFFPTDFRAKERLLAVEGNAVLHVSHRFNSLAFCSLSLLVTLIGGGVHTKW